LAAFLRQRHRPRAKRGWDTTGVPVPWWPVCGPLPHLPELPADEDISRGSGDATVTV